MMPFPVELRRTFQIMTFKKKYGDIPNQVENVTILFFYQSSKINYPWLKFQNDHLTEYQQKNFLS